MGVKLSGYNIKFKFIKDIKNTLPDTLSSLIEFELTETNSPEKEGHEYEYVFFESLQDIHVESNEDIPMPPKTITNMNPINNSIVENESVKHVVM